MFLPSQPSLMMRRRGKKIDTTTSTSPARAYISRLAHKVATSTTDVLDHRLQPRALKFKAPRKVNRSEEEEEQGDDKRLKFDVDIMTNEDSDSGNEKKNAIRNSPFLAGMRTIGSLKQRRIEVQQGPMLEIICRPVVVDVKLSKKMTVMEGYLAQADGGRVVMRRGTIEGKHLGMWGASPTMAVGVCLLIQDPNKKEDFNFFTTLKGSPITGISFLMMDKWKSPIDLHASIHLLKRVISKPMIVCASPGSSRIVMDVMKTPTLKSSTARDLIRGFAFFNPSTESTLSSPSTRHTVIPAAHLKNLPCFLFKTLSSSGATFERQLRDLGMSFVSTCHSMEDFINDVLINSSRLKRSKSLCSSSGMDEHCGTITQLLAITDSPVDTCEEKPVMMTHSSELLLIQCQTKQSIMSGGGSRWVIYNAWRWCIDPARRRVMFKVRENNEKTLYEGDIFSIPRSTFGPLSAVAESADVNVNTPAYVAVRVDDLKTWKLAMIDDPLVMKFVGMASKYGALGRMGRSDLRSPLKTMDDVLNSVPSNICTLASILNRHVLEGEENERVTVRVKILAVDFTKICVSDHSLPKSGFVPVRLIPAGIHSAATFVANDRAKILLKDVVLSHSNSGKAILTLDNASGQSDRLSSSYSSKSHLGTVDQCHQTNAVFFSIQDLIRDDCAVGEYRVEALVSDVFFCGTSWVQSISKKDLKLFDLLELIVDVKSNAFQPMVCLLTCKEGDVEYEVLVNVPSHSVNELLPFVDAKILCMKSPEDVCLRRSQLILARRMLEVLLNKGQSPFEFALRVNSSESRRPVLYRMDV